MTSDPIVVEAIRSGFAESSHLVDVAVVDGEGKLIAYAGDPRVRAAFRSSAKPIQARVALDSGWQPQAERLLSLGCASHYGEPSHVEGVKAILSDAGLDEGALRCPPALPAAPDALAAARAPARVYHNCSGKHAAMLAACVAAGWPLDTYRAVDHPLQERIIDLIADLSGERGELLVDGCGVPTPVGTLSSFARAFVAIDGARESDAMRAHPEMVAGTASLDSLVMRSFPALLMKSGAEGLVCVSTGTIGVALKSRDGAGRPRGPALLRILRELAASAGGGVPSARGTITLETLDAGDGVFAEVVLGGGEPVGALTARGALRLV